MPPRKRKTPDPGAANVPIEAPAPAPDETRTHDLLPPPPVAAPLRRIGLHRIAGYSLGERLLARRGRRPAGNSRRFWSKIEDDDPFLPRPRGASPLDEGTASLHAGPSHDVYAADRLSRNPAPGPARSPRAEPGAAPSSARARQTHTPESRTAPPPRPPQPKPQPPPKPRPAPPEPAPRPAPAEPAPPFDRRPPRIVPNEPARTSGRVPAAPTSSPTVRHQLVDAQGRSAAEVRRETEKARSSGDKPGPPKPRSLDEILGILGELKIQEQLHRDGLLVEPEPEVPRPKPKSVVQPAPRTPSVPARPSPSSQAKPAPKPAPQPPARPAAPEDDEPDLPPPPVNRSPAAATGAGGLDDLFGSGEPRVKIGKRTVSKPKPDEGG